VSHQPKVALITGGTRGIGLGMAKALAAEGHRVALNGVRAEADARGALDEVRALGGEVIYCRGDVGRAADRAAIIDAVREKFGALHFLINNAGITSPGRKDILEANEESFDRVMAVNLKGPYFLTQLAAKWMIEQRAADPNFSGCVVNVSSVSAEMPSINRGDYCLAKAATGMGTKLWAARLAEHNIAVYEIQPGVIRSDMTAGAVEKYDRLIAEGLNLERRWGEPADLGRVAAMLVRGDLPYATGQVLKIDGGMTIRPL
jgi:NAD(P)-dependent dehydrogenase (short-subunit alcohol dehydrogenase family)